MIGSLFSLEKLEKYTVWVFEECNDVPHGRSSRLGDERYSLRPCFLVGLIDVVYFYRDVLHSSVEVAQLLLSGGLFWSENLQSRLSRL